MPTEPADQVTEQNENNTAVIENGEAEHVEKGEPSEAETRARRMGWHPKDEYEASGRDVSKWVDAEAFIQKGESELPILRDRNRKLDGKVAKMEKQLEEGNKLLGDLVKHQAETTRKAVEKALNAAKAERREAISNGDVQRAEELSEEIAEHQEELKKPAPVVETKKNGADIPAEVVEWAEENKSWFIPGEPEHATAVAFYGKLDKNLSETEKLRRTKVEVAKRYPEKFTNPNRTKPPTVEGNNGQGRNRAKGQSWDDLPADVKGLAERLIKQGAVKDKAAYVKSYFGDAQSAA